MKKGGHYTISAERRRYIAVLVFALLFLSFLAKQSMSGFERSVLESIYGWPVRLQQFFFFVTQLGSGWIAAFFCVWALLTQKLRVSLPLIGACLSSVLVVELLKRIIDRPRPYASVAGVLQRDTLTSGGLGFPSGHSAMAVVLACFLATQIPKKYHPLLVLGVILIGLSRIYLGMHSPLDVVGGFTIGYLLSVLFFMPNRLAKPISKA